MVDFKLDFDTVKIEKTILDAAKTGLYAAGEAILTEAQLHVPKDEANRTQHKGELQDSGSVSEIDGVVYVSYNTPYAVRLHENPQYTFQGAPMRGGKWLENAVKTMAPDITVIMARTIKIK